MQPSSAHQFIQTDPIPLEELLHLRSEIMTPMSPLSVTDCERPAITLMMSAQSLKESERGFNNNRRSARSSNRRQSRKDSGTSPLMADTQKDTREGGAMIKPKSLLEEVLTHEQITYLNHMHMLDDEMRSSMV